METYHTIRNTNADKENKAPTATLASTPLLHYIGVIISNKSEPELQHRKPFFNDSVQLTHSPSNSIKTNPVDHDTHTQSSGIIAQV